MRPFREYGAINGDKFLHRLQWVTSEVTENVTAVIDSSLT